MTGIAIALALTQAEARAAEAIDIDIAAGTLPGAIAELAQEARVSIGSEGALPRIRTPRLRGRITVDAALSRLLAHSDFVARQVGDRAWRIERRRKSDTRPESALAPGDEVLPPVAASPPIVVTGSKRDLALSRLPMAVSVVMPGEDHIPGSGDGSATIASLTEGFALTGRGPGRNRMFLRGVADGAFNGENQSTVAVFLDDSRLTYAAPDPDLRLVDVEQVEVMKGPQGALYGTGALGGIYRVVTRKPQYADFTLESATRGEAVATGGLGYSASLVANLPLVADTAALRVVGYTGRDAGWIESGARSDSNATQILGARATLGLAIGDAWEVQMGGMIQLLDSKDTQYVYEPRKRTRPAQLPEPHDNDLRHSVLRLTGKLGDVQLTGNSGYSWHEVRDRLDATIGASQFGLANPRNFIDNRQFRVWDSELRANGHLGRIDWLLGISHVEARQSFLVTLDDGSSANLLVLDDDRRKNNDSALFADLSLPITDQIRFEIGGRLFDNTIVESRITEFGLVSRELKKRGLTPTISLAWTPRDSRLLFVRYGSAFRPGGADISGDGTVEALDGDELATIEAGWREHLPGNGMVELGAFYSRWENIQSDVLQPDGLLESANVGNGRIFGFEATGRFPIGENWQIGAGANFTHAVLVGESPGPDLDGRHLPVVPEFTLRGTLTHSFALAGQPAMLTARIRYIGPARLSFDPAINRPMGKVLESSLSARARLSGMDVELAIENLFDRRSDTFAYGNPLRFATTRQYTPQTPLTVRVAVHRLF